MCFGYPTIIISLSAFKPLPSQASFAQAYFELVLQELWGFCLLWYFLVYFFFPLHN